MRGGRRLRSDLSNRGFRVHSDATVITVCLNAKSSIDRTIDSIAAQNLPVEYIIIDGGSTDGTVDRLRDRSADIDLWISEPDSGISEAFNKGIALSSGTHISLVNADDWLEPKHLAVAIELLRRHNVDYVFGDLMLHTTDGTPRYVLRGDRDYRKRLAHCMPTLNHPTVVCRRRAYELTGQFDTRLRLAMDYDWFVRADMLGLRGHYVPGLLAHMTLDGASVRQAYGALAEVRQISISHGYPRLPAHLRFAARVAKTCGRQMLERYFPGPPYHLLRALLNPRYRSTHTGR